MSSTVNMTRRYPGSPRGLSVIGRDGGGVEARELEAAVAVGGAHHGDLDALAAHSGDAARPFAFDGHAAFEGKAEFGEELRASAKCGATSGQSTFQGCLSRE